MALWLKVDASELYLFISFQACTFHYFVLNVSAFSKNVRLLQVRYFHSLYKRNGNEEWFPWTIYVSTM